MITKHFTVSSSNAEPFSGHSCGTLLTQFRHFSCREVAHADPAGASPMLGARHQFPLGSPAFTLFLFYETITGLMSPRPVTSSRQIKMQKI